MTAAAAAGPGAAGAEDRLELLVERRGDSLALLSPGVGLFVAARGEGDLLTGGAPAGVLLVLGRTVALVAPAGVDGRITSSPSTASVRTPVGWGDLLYEIRSLDLEPLGSGGRTPTDPSLRRGEDPSDPRPVFRSPQSGRFYLRPSPSEEPFVEVGGVVEDGQPLGLIEVMKTFAHVRYAAGGGLPPRARIVGILVEDGAEVGVGDAIVEVEPFPADESSPRPGT
jgi:biotin carboxyl carrier protein